MSQIYGHLEKKNEMIQMMMNYDSWYSCFMGKKMNYGGLEGFLLMNYELTWENMTTLW